MSILKVANVHFEATGTNRIDYLNDGTIRAAGNLRITNAATDTYLYIGEGTGVNDFGYMQWDSTKNRIVISGGSGEGLVLSANGQEGLLFEPSPDTYANVNIRAYDFKFDSTTALFQSLTDFQFRTAADTFDPANLAITSTGNVTIGRDESTVGLGVKLDVNGSINCSNIFVNGNVVSGGGTTIFTANLGNGSANSFNVAHNLNNLFVIPAVREYSSGYYIYPDVKTTTPDHIVIEFVNAPSTNQYAVLVVG